MIVITKKLPRPMFIRKRNGKLAVAAWACGKCGAIRQTSKMAMECCCYRLCDCGKAVSSGYIRCYACRKEEDERKEREVYEKATPIPAEKWWDYVYVENFDEFYPNIGEAWDAIRDEVMLQEETRVYATKATPFELSADDLVYGALEDHYEGAGANISAGQVALLQESLDKWCHGIDIITYFADRTKKIDIPQEWWDEYRAEFEEDE